MEYMRAENSETILVSLMKIWCMVHRTNLVWQSVSHTVPELNFVFQQLTGLCSYFHSSGLHTPGLRSVAADNNLQLLNLPGIFEVRWTQFTADLLNSVLISWHALVLFFQSSAEKTAKRYLNFLCFDNLKLLAVLADVLIAFSRCENILQSDSTTIVDIDTVTSSMKCKLE